VQFGHALVLLCQEGLLTLSRAGQERRATDVRPGHGQESTNQKVNHVRRSIGQAAELEGGRFAVARQSMQAAGKHGKARNNADLGPFRYSRETRCERPLMILGARPQADLSPKMAAEGRS
jgi:hypothetical protein